jgi:hypothetical protein
MLWSTPSSRANPASQRSPDRHLERLHKNAPHRHAGPTQLAVRDRDADRRRRPRMAHMVAHIVFLSELET